MVPPTAEYLGAAVDKALWGSTWEVLVTRRSRERTSSARKAFTTFMSFAANHPFLERFALVTKVSSVDKTQKKAALASVSRVLYYILWHARVKFPGIIQKTKTQTMDATPQDPSASRGLLIEIQHHLNEGIRRLSTSRRNANRLLRYKEVRNVYRVLML